MRILIFIGMLVLVACKTGKKEIPDRNTESSSEQKHTISGSVTQSQSYCGGARPTDEILREITSPKPYSGYTFYVRQGKSNDVTKKYLLEVKADESGKFKFQLPPGDYILVDAIRLDSTYYKTILKTYGRVSESYSMADTACMNVWLKSGLFQFTVVGADISNVNWNIHSQCFVDVPCVSYLGPYPP